MAPASGWIKVNTDGAAQGSPGVAASAGLFKDDQGSFLGGFGFHLGVFSPSLLN